MKKFLSLVLALVMTMSLVTISAGAKDFTDDSKLNYKEAVDVVSTISIVDGYADGSFNPGATLTRGAAAKIICNLILGPTTASALAADAAPYSDVPANSTFAGYIAYCQKQGIISGYADGTFKPGNTLTGYAFMKMLLGALGYDADIEGYTGANWSISVAKQAIATGLDDGLVDDFNGVKPVTREEAALYAFNTLQADLVTYDTKGTNITIGDTTINTGASKAELEGHTFMGKYFTKLTKSTVNDDLKNTATRWMYKGKEVGTYAKTPDAVYTKKVSSKTIYEDLGLVQTFAASVYEDGAAKANFTVQSNDSDSKIGGNGVTLNVYLTKNAQDTVTAVKIAMINTYVGKVIEVGENADKERVVILDTETDKYVTEEFEKDDIVIYTKDVTATPDAIQSMAVVEKQTGKLSKIVGANEEFTIDGTTYKASKKAVVGGDVDVKDEVTFYLDANGYLIKIDEAEDNLSVENIAYVETINNARGDYAVLRLADGTKKTVDIDKDYSTALNGDMVGRIVSFKENADGTYKLSDLSGAKLSPNTTVNFTNGKPGIDTNGSPASSEIKTNSKTAFVYKLTDDSSFKVYTGYKNAAGITGDGDEKYVVYNKDGVAVMVYVEIEKSDLANTAADLTVIAYDDGVDLVNEGDGVTYYEFNAVVDGKITTVKVDNTAGLWATVSADEICVSAGLTFDSDEIGTAISGAPASVTEAANPAVLPVKNDIITIGGVALAYTDDVKVFFVDEDAEITAGTIASISKDTNSGSTDPYGRIAYNVDTDGLVDLIVIVKK